MMRSSLTIYRVLLLILPIVWISTSMQAQYEPVEVFGQVKDQDTQEFIGQGTVIATDRHNAAFTISAEWDEEGRYSMILPYDRSFRIEFISPGYVSRHVLVDLNGVAMAHRRAGFGMSVDAVLFKQLPGVDYSVFEEEPTGICLYDKEQKTFVWDMSYIVSTKKLVEETLEQHRSNSGSPIE